ncbi:MAG: glycogen debranching protein GlgX, partial [Actinomycetota bacterium]|nr:glycogen debranching protein GlgX [Actinomycetota bacterium]
DVAGDDLVCDSRDSAPYVPKSVVVDDRFAWGDDAPPGVPWPDTVLYELHVRGFTMAHPAVPTPLRGTYAGLAHPAVVEHLVALGVTSVELLPVHHFVSEPHLVRGGRGNYWGYNSLAFLAPHAPYSAAGQLGQQVGEFKAMVKALHAAGLEVILDVVYNHTAEQGETGPTLSLRGIDNRGYYRLADGGRRYRDYTGCGNTLDTQSPAALQLVTDSLRYWVQEMHVDGFRFDLASALARGRGSDGLDPVDPTGAFLATVAQDPVLRGVKLVAEPWDVAAGGYQLGRFPHPWAQWNDRFRDTVRDYWRGRSSGVRELGCRLSGSSDLYEATSPHPYASVNFDTAHDGMTARDLVSYDRKHNEANGEDNRDGTGDDRSWNCGVEGETDDAAVLALRRQQLGNLLATLLLSAGVPMLVAGDELGRTQRGNNNGYCLDDETGWVDWEGAAAWQDVQGLVRRLLALRRDHPVFRRHRFFTGRPVVEGGRKDLAWFGTDGREMDTGRWEDTSAQTLGVYLAGDGIPTPGPHGERVLDDSFLLWLHAGAEPVNVMLPGAPWASAYEVILDTAEVLPGGTLDAESQIPLGARSVLVCRAVS